MVMSLNQWRAQSAVTSVMMTRLVTEQQRVYIDTALPHRRVVRGPIEWRVGMVCDNTPGAYLVNAVGYVHDEIIIVPLGLAQRGPQGFSVAMKDATGGRASFMCKTIHAAMDTVAALVQDCVSAIDERG